MTQGIAKRILELVDNDPIIRRRLEEIIEESKLENKMVFMHSYYPREGIKLSKLVDVNELDSDMDPEDILDYLEKQGTLKSLCKNYIEFFVDE